MIPLPYRILAIFIAGLTVYFYAHHAGYAERDQEMQLEIAKKNEEARQTEQLLTEKINDNATKLQEANNAITQKQTALDRAIRAGRVRLPAPSCVQAPTDTPAAAGNRDETGSDAERQTLAAIAALVAEGDRNTTQLNACIDAYNQMKEQLNGQRN